MTFNLRALVVHQAVQPLHRGSGGSMYTRKAHGTREAPEQLANADFVLMVCAEIYHRRLMKQEQPGMGLGGTWEGNLIVAGFYSAGAISTKFVPVLFSHADTHCVPLWAMWKPAFDD